MASKSPKLASKSAKLASKVAKLASKPCNRRESAPNASVKAQYLRKPALNSMQSRNWRVKVPNSRVKLPNWRVTQPFADYKITFYEQRSVL
ncbi:hypothetical protein ACQKGI_06940 [Peribacillus muralis]|uniref:hypothetical protein n=1 Tax=Peribacillus muralis TaxID=264697 RepID=UPI0037FBA93E